MVANEDEGASFRSGTFLHQQPENLQIGHPIWIWPIEQREDAPFRITGVLRETNLLWPTRGGSQQARRKVLNRVDLLEEASVNRCGKLDAKHRIDHGIEGNIMGGRRAIEEPRVAQHHMIQFMHDQHEEVFVGAAMVSHKLRIDEQPWANPALHRGSGNRFVDGDVHQSE